MVVIIGSPSVNKIQTRIEITNGNKKAPAVDIQQRPLKHSHGALLSALYIIKSP
ncbi:hypothetical protein J2T02_000943 [Chitinophaga terrae (ex Kim and Jung 2007)]|jgi:hypothetical protein|nr:hypothetical protein [Chitinophaga terrae (ex Kim and Jung 2007)]